MSIPDKSIRLNANFLENLDSSYTPLYINRDGRISEQNGIISKVFTKIFGEPKDGLQVYRNAIEGLMSKRCDPGKYRNVKDEQMFRIFLTSLLGKLESHGVLTPQLKEQILIDNQDRLLNYYKLRYAKDPLESFKLENRAKAAMEMSSDPLLSQNYKKDVGAFELDAEKSGVSLSYFIKDKQGIIGIFKPEKGEIGMPLNYSESGARSDPGYPSEIGGVPIGSMWKSEIASYEFAKDSLGNIPQTIPFQAVIKIGRDSEPQNLIGSLQMFVKDSENIQDRIIRLKSNPYEKVSKDQTQGLALRDLLIGNQDRHQYNLIFKKDQIFGIDHGNSFSSGLIRKENRIQRTVTILFDKTPCKEPVSASVVGQFNEIKIEDEAQRLIDQGLINPKQALELKMRHYLLQRLIEISPKLTVEQISIGFFDLKGSDGILKRAIDYAFEKLLVSDVDLNSNRIQNNLFLMYKKEVDSLLKDPKTISNLK